MLTALGNATILSGFETTSTVGSAIAVRPDEPRRLRRFALFRCRGCSENMQIFVARQTHRAENRPAMRDDTDHRWFAGGEAARYSLFELSDNRGQLQRRAQRNFQ
ncbi:hypothetical protein [Bradyrhizobium yuanmingense]|uniref:hypothetical protein n=1 Tax=Bradyrhizobium yuanmingense TaxID=108015 RepID=UPI0023BA32F8|nr:hypothetical protein [Bradyrhizobium yuanmingense]MDF0581577.1 hypothetical protein [Bradyrhizobium yuanmingense]